MISMGKKCELCLWNQGSGGGGGGGDMFVTLGTISAANVPMTYDDEEQRWAGSIISDVIATITYGGAGQNLTMKINGEPYSVEVIAPNTPVTIEETNDTEVYLHVVSDEPFTLYINSYGSDEPIITDLSMVLYAPSPELAVFLGPNK